MDVIKTVLVALLVLLSGDFISTFFYHVPEHIFGKFHTLIHHSNNRSFIDYAVKNKKPLVLFFGFLGFVPYFIFVPWFWMMSPLGTLLGLVLGECHVVWRHSSSSEWKTPDWIQRCCNVLCITTPERHWLHHQNAKAAYGDIFTFYDKPAQRWFRILLSLKRKLKKTRISFNLVHSRSLSCGAGCESDLQ
ncbi:MAG TPA: sterol desaturase family protein [Coleofasciculaceae cyanobacterium]